MLAFNQTHFEQVFEGNKVGDEVTSLVAKHVTKTSNSKSHSKTGSKLDYRLLKQIPEILTGVVQKKRVHWSGFESKCTLVLKSNVLLQYKGVVSESNRSTKLPVKVYDLKGSTVAELNGQQIRSQRSLSTSALRVPSIGGGSHRSTYLSGATSFTNRNSNSKFVFEICFANGTKRVFAAPSRIECSKWVFAIANASGIPSYDDFIKVVVLGKGHFGKVFLSIHRPSGGLVALKQISQKAGKLERLLNERSIIEKISNISSPFLGKTMYALRHPTSGDLVYANELYIGGDMWGLLRKKKRLGTESTKFIASEVMLGIQALHEFGIVHRDIKLENVLFDQTGHIKLIDFGLSKELTEVSESAAERSVNPVQTGDKQKSYLRTFSVCGTNYYMPPEMLTGGHGHGLALDWWQLGCFVYELYVGRPAFYEVGAKKIHRKILSGPPQFPSKEKVNMPMEAKDLILKFLRHSSSLRLGSQGWEEIAAHPFFADVSFEALKQKQVHPPKEIMMYIDETVGGKSSVFETFMKSSEDSNPAATFESATGLNIEVESKRSSTAELSLESTGTQLSNRSKKPSSTETVSKLTQQFLDQVISFFPDATNLDGKEINGQKPEQFVLDEKLFVGPGVHTPATELQHKDPFVGFDLLGPSDAIQQSVDLAHNFGLDFGYSSICSSPSYELEKASRLSSHSSVSVGSLKDEH